MGYLDLVAVHPDVVAALLLAARDVVYNKTFEFDAEPPPSRLSIQQALALLMASRATMRPSSPFEYCAAQICTGPHE